MGATMDDVMLEALVERAAGATAYPATPMLRGRVLAAIAEPPSGGARRARMPRVVLAAMAVGVLAAIAIALAVPSSRSALAEFFGIDGLRIERLPGPVPGVTPTPLPAPGDLPSIAERVSLAEAERRAAFRATLPPGASGVARVYVKTYSESDTVIILHYAAFDLWEARPRDVFFHKGLPEGVVALDATVGGQQAKWIESGPHVALVFDTNGAIPGSERTVARDTLIWRTEFALYRMETTLPLAEAIRVAETLP
ncbi:MAG: hypothetical protein HY874_02385 [Chloroflexi bacterium]|nr:hypothetical protein [Chloroflexota bacterium]